MVIAEPLTRAAELAFATDSSKLVWLTSRRWLTLRPDARLVDLDAGYDLGLGLAGGVSWLMPAQLARYCRDTATARAYLIDADKV